MPEFVTSFEYFAKNQNDECDKQHEPEHACFDPDLEVPVFGEYRTIAFAIGWLDLVTSEEHTKFRMWDSPRDVGPVW